MDSFPTLIPIKHVLRVSEEELKTKLESPQGINGEAKAVKEIPGLKCRIDLHRRIRRDETVEDKKIIVATLRLLNIKEDVGINSSIVFCIKSAGFLKYHHSAYYHRRFKAPCGIDVCSSADLFDPEKKYIVDGEFAIEMKGIIFFKKEEMINYGINFADRLWEDEDERDFTINVKEENGCKSEIKVHKIVLGLRSPVFKRMFKTDMKEKEEGKVEIIDFDLDTVKTAIAYCYDQDIYKKYRGWRQLISLQKFADKYDIEDLKRNTELDLVEQISFKNICEIANAAINLNAPELQNFCFRFLLLAVKEGIPFKDIDNLDNGIAADLLKKSMADKYC